MTEVFEVLKWTAITVGWTVTPVILLTLAGVDFRKAIKFKHNDFLWTSNMWSATLYSIVGLCFPIAAIITIIRFFAS